MAGKRFAAIDVGSFEVEMGIYETTAKNGIRAVDSVRHVIALGSDTYSTGIISYGLVQELIAVLTDFTEIMRSYKVTAYRAVASSAMREAKNGAIVLDQIRVRTGLEVQVNTNPELRLLSIKGVAAKGADFERIIAGGTAVVDLGFGSMQITLYDQGQMVSSQNLKIGVLRILEMLSSLNSARDERSRILGEMVDHELDVYRRLHLGERRIRNIIALGDPFFTLYDRLMRRQDKDPKKDVFADRKRLENFYQFITSHTDGELAGKLGLGDEAAGNVLPTAVILRGVIEALDAETVWFPGVRLIDGIAADYAFSHKVLKQTHDFDADIIAAVRQIASRYGEDSAHRSYAVENTIRIFDALKKSQGFTERDRLLIRIPAMLHHCGRFVNMGSGSLSSYEIIRATEIPGLSRDEQELVVQVLRNEEGVPRWQDLSMKVAKMTAIIRLADALDRSAKQKAGEYKVVINEDGELVVSTKFTGDLTLEQISFEHNSPFFSEIFGIEPVFKQKRLM